MNWENISSILLLVLWLAMFLLRVFFILQLLLVSDICSAQVADSCSRKTAPPRKGVYMSFKEYLNNQPSYTGEFSVVGDYKIKFADSSFAKKTIQPWGYSNGKNAYIFFRDHSNGFSFNSGSYHLIGIRGKLSHFAASTVYHPILNESPYTGFGFQGVRGSELSQYLITERGEIMSFTNKRLKQALASDPELLEQFKSYHGADRKYKFLRLYNCRHSSPL